MWEWVPAGFLLGVVGSAHCVGMCGPLALAIPKERALRHHLGRVAGYAVLGAGMGTLGQVVHLGGFHKSLTIAAGLLVMLTAVTGWSAKGAWVTAWMAPLWRSRRPAAAYALGVLNAWLPCGLVYSALAAALAVATPAGSAVFMAVFGLGTVPALLALAWAGGRMPAPWRDRLRRVAPAFVLALGLLLVLRGLELGIPLVSPGRLTCH